MAEKAQQVVRPTTLRLWKYGSVQGIAASGVSTAVIPTGDNVHALKFYCQSAVPAVLSRAQLITDIAGIRVFLNGETIVDLTMTEILDMYKYHYDKFGALAAPLGVVVIPFTRAHLPAWDLNRGFAIGMRKSSGNGFNSLSYEVTFAAGLVTLATMECHVVTDTYPQEPTGAHVRMLRTTRDFTGTGDWPIDNMPVTPAGILAYHVLDTNLARITVTKDTTIIYNDVPYDVLEVMMDEAGRTPQAAWTHIPFDLANDLNGYERLRGYVQTGAWVVKPYCSAAPGAGTIIVSEEVHNGVRE